MKSLDKIYCSDPLHARESIRRPGLSKTFFPKLYHAILLAKGLKQSMENILQREHETYFQDFLDKSCGGGSLEASEFCVH